MVKVECEGCKAPYQIEERRIPASGLKMRCPKCGTSVLVQKPGSEGAAPAAAPAAPRPAAPPRPAPPRPGGSDPDLPAPAAPKPKGGGGFGEIDLGVDIPGVGDVGAAGGGVMDLPAPVGAAPPPPPAGNPGEVDLPAVPAARPAPPPPGGAGGGFGEVDLPAPRAQKPPPPPGGTRPMGAPSASFGAVDLPVVGGGVDLPSPAGGGVGLPAPAGGGGPGEIDLPSPAGGGVGLPAPAGGGVGLPAPAGGAGLPAPAGGAGLPAPAGVGLPAAADAGLPTVGPGFPVASGGAGLPTPSGGNLPVSGDLPQVTDPGLPAGMAAAAAGGAAAAGAIVGADLYAEGGPAGAMGVSGIGSAATAPMPGASGPVGGDPFGAPPEADPFGGAPPPPPGEAGGGDAFGDAGGGVPAGGADAGIDHGFGGAGGDAPAAGGGFEFGDIGIGDSGGSNDIALDSMRPAGGDGLPDVGGEASLDGGGVPIDLPPGPKKSVAPTVEIAPKKSPVVRNVAIGVIVFAIGGAALTLVEGVGPFGFHFISDKVNAGAHDTALADLRSQSLERLDADVYGDAKKADAAAAAAVDAAPRHASTKAYAAYLIYIRGLRYGHDAGPEVIAKQHLDAVADADSSELKLARAAQDASTGQLARARQTVATVITGAAGDVDALVLSGEIELAAKAPDKAIEVWERAVKTRKSARTLFGLARAQRAKGDFDAAEASAKGVLEASPKHVAARTLLASVAARSQARDEEAKALLQKVTEDEELRASASPSELVDAYTQLGLLHLARNRISEAEKAFAEGLKLDSQNEAGLIGLAELFFRSGRFTEAQARFEAATHANADSIAARVGSAKTKIKLERAKEAKDELTKLATDHPKSALVHHWAGVAEMELNNAEAAEKAFTTAIEVAGDTPEAVDSYVALSELLLRTGRNDEAAAKLREAQERFPDLAALNIAKGKVMIRSGNCTAAVLEFDKALEQGEDLDALFQKAKALRCARRFDECAATLDKVSQKDKNYPGLALERGLYYEDTGQSERALEMYQEELRAKPDDIDLKLRVGSTQVIAGHPEPAIPLLEEVLAARPNSGEAKHFLGRAYLLLNQKLSQAKKYLEQARDSDPNNSDYWTYVGWVNNATGHQGVAEKALERALELDQNSGDAYWQRAVLNQKQGASKDCIDDAKKALELKPGRSEAHMTMALCHQDQNNMPLAEEAWQQAIAGNPNNAEARFRYGKILADKNNTEGALDNLSKAIELAEAKEPKPAWLHTAHRLLAEKLKGSDATKATIHYKKFLKLSPSENVYRDEACSFVESQGEKCK